ncbi:hypothetical protein GQ457_03G015140 [Hibiscus cannabinus]
MHSDVCGPMNTQARGGYQYFITFTDDFSRYGYAYLMRHKSEAFETFKEFKNEVQNQHGKSIKALLSDRGGEYLSQDFDELLKECGIVSQLTPPGTPQWNRVSERRNRTLLDMSIPEKDFLTNSAKGRNIELKEVQQQQVIEPEVEEISQAVEENATDLETQPLRRSTRERHEPEGYGFLVTTHGDVILVNQDEPKTYQEALASPDSEKWHEAMRSEMDSMSENQVWTLQASRSWNLCFNEAIQEFGFIRNEDEPCVYKKFSGSIVSFLILYSIKTWLSSFFSMKDLGEAAYILGVKIYRDRSRRLLGLSQSTYIDKVLKRISMEESKRGFLPMRHGISLSKEMCPSTPQERERMSEIPYASAIGSIMYAMICTRPDLSYALCMTSRYQANPSEGH